MTWRKILLTSLFLIVTVFALWSNVPGIITITSKDNNFAEIDKFKKSSASACLVNLEAKNYLAARSDCIKTVEYLPENLEAHLNLGLVYYHLTEYDKAIAQNIEVIEQDSQDYRAFYNRGLVYAALGKYQEAIKDYNVALSFAETMTIKQQAIVYNDLSLAYIMQKDYSQAIAFLDLAVELDPNNDGVYFNRGCAYHRQGNYLAGIKDFTKVIALDPEYTEAYISRGILNHLLRREKAAYRDLDIALDRSLANKDRVLYEQILSLKNSMITSQVNQLA